MENSIISLNEEINTNIQQLSNKIESQEIILSD